MTSDSTMACRNLPGNKFSGHFRSITGISEILPGCLPVASKSLHHLAESAESEFEGKIQILHPGANKFENIEFRICFGKCSGIFWPGFWKAFRGIFPEISPENFHEISGNKTASKSINPTFKLIKIQIKKRSVY